MPNEISAIMLQVIEALNKTGIKYAISGSIASSAFGVPRATMDADLIVDIRVADIRNLIGLLEKDFHIEAEIIKNALRYSSSFNIIHFKTSCKVDCYVLKNDEYEQIKFSRRRKENIRADKKTEVWFLSPEDIVLSKLQWFIKSSCISDRQWNDVIGVLKVQGRLLNKKYLQKWSAVLDLRDLLKKAEQASKT
ncbi:MAG: hypothetical protein HZA48_05725 [Planctomycetes bacterium]|nr:hypothetical protein [Planctomycetota bacterium]